jgi:nucleoside-diphosphate-sugar epimerase
MEIAVKKILVLGATGPQGRPVAEKLNAEGYKVRVLVRDAGKAIWAKPASRLLSAT